MTLHLDAEHVVAYAAAIAAALYLGNKLRHGFRLLEALAAVVHHELEHNHGTSMKDDVHGIAIAMGTLQRSHEELRADFDKHVNERKTR